MDKESSDRLLMSASRRKPYAAFRSLREAQAYSDSAVVLEGDWAGQIYVTCPASRVRCGEPALRQLLSDLDRIAWACNEGGGTGVYYERLPVGAVVPGGMGGGIIRDGVWVHDKFIELGMAEAIADVIEGRRTTTEP